MIKAAAEKMKGMLFKKYIFMKPPSDQIKQIAFEKTYEPYFVIEGRYIIDYYQGCTYHIPILDNSVEVVLLNNTFNPEPTKARWQKRTLKLEGEERLIHEKTAYLVLDSKGREVSPERIHLAPQEKKFKKILAEFREKEKPQFGSNWEENVLKSKIAERPPNVKRIVRETLEISNRTLFYVPVYKIWFQKTSTGEEKKIEFDGVTAHMIQ